MNFGNLDFDIPNMEFTLDVSSLAFLSGDIRISSLCTLCLCISAPLPQPAKRSTTVENIRQITPFYAKQSQFWKCQKQHKHFCNNEIRKNGQLVIQTKQTQLKPKQTQFKPNLSFVFCILFQTLTFRLLKL